MSRNPKPSPPPLPVVTSVPERLRFKAAKAFLFASLLEFAGGGFAAAWLMRDWSALWHDKQFVESVYLSYGGMLIYAFGRWGAMILLVLYLSAGALLLAITATVFRTSKRPGCWRCSRQSVCSSFRQAHWPDCMPCVDCVGEAGTPSAIDADDIRVPRTPPRHQRRFCAVHPHERRPSGRRSRFGIRCAQWPQNLPQSVGICGFGRSGRVSGCALSTRGTSWTMPP